mgnify:CR=1 FL=1
MSLLKLLGLKARDTEAPGADRSLDVVASRLANLPRERDLMVAAFATVLVRTARADLRVSPEETDRIVTIVQEVGGLSGDEARLVVEMATQEALTRGASREYLATRELKRLASAEDRRRLLHCLFAVCAADDSISLEEEQEVRQVASELGFELKDYTEARSAFRAQREVLRGLPTRAGSST